MSFPNERLTREAEVVVIYSSSEKWKDTYLYAGRVGAFHVSVKRKANGQCDDRKSRSNENLNPIYRDPFDRSFRSRLAEFSRKKKE